jgi:DNA repair exonuclease SbcCD ATPase subunit
VDKLRHEIGKCEREIAALEPQVDSAKRNLDKARELERQQADAHACKLKAERSHDGRSHQVRALEDRHGQISAARTHIVESKVDQAELQERLTELAQERAELQSRKSAAQSFVTKTEAAVESLGGRIAALAAKRDLLQLQIACEQSQKSIARCEALHEQLAQSEKEVEELGTWPSGAEIGLWRRSFAELTERNRDAATRLQVTLDLTMPATIEWCADSGSVAMANVSPGRPETIGGVRSLRLQIAEVGEIRVNCGASELADLLEEIDERTRTLDAAIGVFGIVTGDLPDGFDRLEELRIAGESAARTVRESKERVREVERELGTLAQLRQKAAQFRQQTSAAQTKYETLQSLVPEGLDAAGVDAEIESLTAQLAGAREQLAQAQVELESASGRVSDLQTQIARSEEAFSQSKARVIELNRRLAELTADGMSDEQRAERAHGLRVELAAAANALKLAEEALAALGPPIGADEVAALARNLDELQERLHDKRQRLAADRGQVCTICGDDPQGAIEELKAEIATIDARLAEENRRLAALALLQKLLAMEKQSLARLIAGPLNERIGPWLRRLRGQETAIVFDPETSRITNVVTETGSGPQELPFDALSEGCKGQVAVLIRLTLSRLIAQQTGSRQFVVLDDPLTETSPDRRPEMFRILHQAAQDLQILFVTCHDDVLATLPGQPHVLAM